jgi:hypothetical protein
MHCLNALVQRRLPILRSLQLQHVVQLQPIRHRTAIILCVCLSPDVACQGYCLCLHHRRSHQKLRCGCALCKSG